MAGWMGGWWLWQAEGSLRPLIAMQTGRQVDPLLLCPALCLCPALPCFGQAEELQRLGLDATKAHRLDTAETAALQYKKKEKKPAPAGW